MSTLPCQDALKNVGRHASQVVRDLYHSFSADSAQPVNVLRNAPSSQESLSDADPNIADDVTIGHAPASEYNDIN